MKGFLGIAFNRRQFATGEGNDAEDSEDSTKKKMIWKPPAAPGNAPACAHFNQSAKIPQPDDFKCAFKHGQKNPIHRRGFNHPGFMIGAGNGALPITPFKVLLDKPTIKTEKGDKKRPPETKQAGGSQPNRQQSQPAENYGQAATEIQAETALVIEQFKSVLDGEEQGCVVRVDKINREFPRSSTKPPGMLNS